MWTRTRTLLHNIPWAGQCPAQSMAGTVLKIPQLLSSAMGPIGSSKLFGTGSASIGSEQIAVRDAICCVWRVDILPFHPKLQSWDWRL